MYAHDSLAYPLCKLTPSDLPPLQDPISFASELIKARSDLGLTQSQLSAKSGVSISAIKAYESGRNMPGTRELRELCIALQISPNKLLFGVESPYEVRSILDLLAGDGDAEDHVAQLKLATLISMLSSDERDALTTLASSIAIARHGEPEVKKRLIFSTFMTGLSREIAKSSKESLDTGKSFETADVVRRASSFTLKYSDQPNPPHQKTPKK